MTEPSHPSEFLWRQYNMYIDLYKFYVDAVVKINAFHFAITGGILSFVLTKTEISIASYGLLLPAFLSFGLAILFYSGSKYVTVMQKDIEAISVYFQFQTRPEVSPLSKLLNIFTVSMH